jgi:hypothetical protein
MFKPSKRPGWIVASESVLESSVNRYRQPQAFKKLVIGSLNILRESVPVNALIAISSRILGQSQAVYFSKRNQRFFIPGCEMSMRLCCWL